MLIVVGNPYKQDYLAYLKRKAKKLLQNNKILFAGYKTSNELVKYYNAADLFIHVSKSEAGPVSIMEAMAYGLPIFCTDTGNTAEVLKENNAGIVVGITNYNEWKEKLIEYFKGKPVSTLDIEVVRKYYDWKKIAEKFIKIYKSI